MFCRYTNCQDKQPRSNYTHCRNFHTSQHHLSNNPTLLSHLRSCRYTGSSRRGRTLPQGYNRKHSLPSNSSTLLFRYREHKYTHSSHKQSHSNYTHCRNLHTSQHPKNRRRRQNMRKGLRKNVLVRRRQNEIPQTRYDVLIRTPLDRRQHASRMVLRNSKRR